MTDISATASTFAATERNAKAGDIIRLAPGTYPGAEFKAHASRKGPITVTAADPASPPRFTGGVTIQNAEGVTFQGVDFDISGATAYYASAVRVYGGKNLSFLGGRIVGRLTADDRWGHGLQIDGVEGLKIAGVSLSTLRRGILLNDCTDAEITDCDLTNIASDGIDISGAVRLLIARNLIKDLFPVGDDHPDGIQQHSVKGARPCKDLTIDDNLIWAGEYGRGKIQGIFLHSEDATRKEGVRVRRNLLIGTGYQGVYVNHSDGLELTGNQVLFEKPAASKPDKSWILVEESKGSAADNKALLITLPAGVPSTGDALNKTATKAQVTDAAAAWMAKFRASEKPVRTPAYPSRKAAFEAWDQKLAEMRQIVDFLKAGEA